MNICHSPSHSEARLSPLAARALRRVQRSINVAVHSDDAKWTASLVLTTRSSRTLPLCCPYRNDPQSRNSTASPGHVMRLLCRSPTNPDLPRSDIKAAYTTRVPPCQRTSRPCCRLANQSRDLPGLKVHIGLARPASLSRPQILHHSPSKTGRMSMQETTRRSRAGVRGSR